MASHSERPKGEAPDRELPQRRSTRVDRGKPQGVVAREELEKLLRAHDPDVAAENLGRLGPQHGPLLRLIATEGSSANDDPRVRHNAIAALGHLGRTEDVNLLVELARSDPDPAVRASAMTTLANTGMVLAAPVLRDALASRDPVERTAAEKSLTRLASVVGVPAVLEAVRVGTRGARLVKAVEEVFQSPANVLPSSAARSRPARSLADEEPERGAKPGRKASPRRPSS